MTLKQMFHFGDIHGEIRKFTPRRCEVDQAIYLTALGKTYPELDTITQERDHTILELARIGTAVPFARLAAQIVYMEGKFFPDARTGTLEEINAAYLDYVYDESGLWDYLQEIADALDNPNGNDAGV